VLGRAGIRARAFAKLFPDEAAADAGERASESGSQAEVATDAGVAVVAGTIEEVPTTIGRFRVVGRIGHGGMGVVVRAHDPELDRHVAIKLLRPELRASGSAGSIGPARLLREAQAMARINDPNVITVHEVGTVGDQVFQFGFEIGHQAALELVEVDIAGAHHRGRVLVVGKSEKKMFEGSEFLVAFVGEAKRLVEGHFKRAGE